MAASSCNSLVATSRLYLVLKISKSELSPNCEFILQLYWKFNIHLNSYCLSTTLRQCGRKQMKIVFGRSDLFIRRKNKKIRSIVITRRLESFCENRGPNF